MEDLMVYVNKYMLITMIITTVVMVEVVREVVVEGVEVLRERLTRRVVEDLDLISEMSRFRQALILKRKIHVDIHGSIHGCGHPWILPLKHIHMDVVRAIHGYPTGYPSTAVTACPSHVFSEFGPTRLSFDASNDLIS
jgi:hypothetical protein